MALLAILSEPQANQACRLRLPQPISWYDVSPPRQVILSKFISTCLFVIRDSYSVNVDLPVVPSLLHVYPQAAFCPSWAGRLLSWCRMCWNSASRLQWQCLA